MIKKKHPKGRGLETEGCGPSPETSCRLGLGRVNLFPTTRIISQPLGQLSPRLCRGKATLRPQQPGQETRAHAACTDRDLLLAAGDHSFFPGCTVTPLGLAHHTAACSLHSAPIKTSSCLGLHPHFPCGCAVLPQRVPGLQAGAAPSLGPLPRAACPGSGPGPEKTNLKATESSLTPSLTLGSCPAPPLPLFPI